MLDSRFSRRKVPTTAEVKMGRAHEIDAIAYDTPNTNIEVAVRSRPPRWSFGSARTGS
jgi:hypothetical protein